MKKKSIRIVVRASRRKESEACAVMHESWSHDCQLTVYSDEGHCGATYGWYRRTRPATKEEAAPVVKAMARQYAPEYTLIVGKKLTK